jgi:hypothetical protein
MSGTPGLIGSAKEHPARRQLERLLPYSAAIGSGIVIDSFGKTSKQQDIIIYDRQCCPVFSINDTPEATFYPCEGVIAVGEVKSTMNTKEVLDSIAKIQSVKKLRRASIPVNGLDGLPTFPWRQYGDSGGLFGTVAQQYDQAHNELDQIYSFVLCAKFGLIGTSMHKLVTAALAQMSKEEAPNAFISLEDGFIVPQSSSLNSLLLSLHGATGMSFCAEKEKAFLFLLTRLNHCVRSGRTVSIGAFDKYFLETPDEFHTTRMEFVAA